jgi:NADPH:quinone reductase-like Zn-dependent oxidoreductase
MKAAQFSQFGGPEVLEIVDLPDPHPGPGQIRVAVHAAGINATESKLRRGLMGGDLPQTTGRDVAGVVDELGEGVTDVAIGDRVFGLSDDNAGAAELTLVTHYAPIPESVSFTEAAGLPVAIETSTRSLDALGVTAGTTLLVSGAAGGIGGTAVQLAVARGAHVIGTASPVNHDYLRRLGAEPVAYGEGLAERVRALAPHGVDRAMDVAGSGVLPDLIELTGTPDHVVTIADIEGAQKYGVKFSSGADGHAFHALTESVPLIAAGKLVLPTAQTFPLTDIAEAHRVSEAGHVRGRLILTIA